MDLDELNIQHGLPGRPESPALETTARLAVEAGLRDLLVNKLLYQKVEVSLAGLQTALRKVGVDPLEARLGELQHEITVRPWRLETRHFGDDARMAEVLRYASMGCQTPGTPVEDLNLHFFAPSVPFWCRKCKSDTTFVAIHGASDQGLVNPFPRRTERGTEQVYTVIYRCEVCRAVLFTILVRREGLRLHLCGFAPRREQKAPRVVPKHLEVMLLDAANAVAEGDLFAGCYHLRTMLEHYLKHELGIAADFQIRGDELVAQYNGTLPDALKESLPSLKIAYEKLSQVLHSRVGSNDDYAAQQAAVCDHIEGVALLRRYQR